MYIYIDEEIEADTLEGFKAKLLVAAEMAWGREVADEAEETYRQLASLAGILPPPSSSPFDVISPEVLELWGKEALKEIREYNFFTGREWDE